MTTAMETRGATSASASASPSQAVAASTTLPLSEEALTAALEHFAREGYARLGRVASDDALEALRARADALMQGHVTHDGLFFQRDADSGRYEDLPYGKGFQGPSLDYRKIEKLELDPVFRAWLENPVFERVARGVLGAPVFLLRAMIMTKPARGGTPLPWHQDAGRFWGVTTPPRLQLWTALDDAPADSGAVEVFPRSHLDGLATLQGGVVPRAIVDERGADARAVSLPCRAGEVLLIHNLAWHRSGINVTAHARRAFSVCFVDETVKCTRTRKAPRVFPRVFSR